LSGLPEELARAGDVHSDAATNMTESSDTPPPQLIRGFRLGRLYGIDLLVEPSWFLLVGLLVWLMSSQVFEPLYPGASSRLLLMGALCVLLLFLSMIAHELAHALVAQRLFGMRVPFVRLTFFGGTAGLLDDPPHPRAEFFIISAGPFANAIIGLGLGGAVYALQPDLFAQMLDGKDMSATPPSRVILAQTAMLNVALAFFNLLPIFPLDGGRLVRAGLWAISGRIIRGTRQAAALGRILCYAMIGLGVGLALEGDPGSGIMLVLTGWMLSVFSRNARLGTELREGLRGVTAAHLMTPDPPSLAGQVTLESAAAEFLRLNQKSLPVIDFSGDFLGMTTPKDFRSIPRAEWTRMTVQHLLTQRDDNPRPRTVVSPDATGLDVYIGVVLQPGGRLPVVKGSRLVGIVSRATVREFLRNRGL